MSQTQDFQPASKLIRDPGQDGVGSTVNNPLKMHFLIKIITLTTLNRIH